MELALRRDMEEQRLISDRHLEAMGRDMRDIIYSDELTTNVDANKLLRNTLTLTFRAHRIDDWSFYDETKLMGEGAVSYCRFDEHPGLDNIASWVHDQLIKVFEQDQTSMGQITDILTSRGTHIGTIIYLPEAIEHFSHHATRLGQSFTVRLTAHPFFIEKLPNVKLFFITEEDVLIDFFFWRVAAVPRALLASSSSSASEPCGC